MQRNSYGPLRQEPRSAAATVEKGLTVALHWSPSQKDRAELAHENVD
jgi:hypothetical protein